MSVVSLLDAIKAFLEEHVTLTIQLQKPSDSNIYCYELEHPSVHVGYIPPKGFMPQELASNTIPCLVVSLDDYTDDGQDKDISVRVTGVVYSPGMNIVEDGKSTFTPDFQGFRDLLNLLERTSAALLKRRFIDSVGTVQLPLKMGMYEEQEYPYWYGWITFTIRQTGYPASELAKFL